MCKKGSGRECNVKVRLGEHLCTTWHTYTQNRRSILKKTYWYVMACTNDASMKPQEEEGIDAIQWFTEAEATTALMDSYPSMRYLLKKYLKKNLGSLKWNREGIQRHLLHSDALHE